MKLPHYFFQSPFFQFSQFSDLLKSVGLEISESERRDAQALLNKRLPPVTSEEMVCAIFGINRGLLWSFLNSQARHYRTFSIPKGNGTRQIQAPRVALKILQKWIGTQLANSYDAPDHVFGFVPGRSHLQAAQVHTGANWVFSVDIENFFPSTPIALVGLTLRAHGLGSIGSKIISELACLNGFLPQGAPSSPAISNLCFRAMDNELAAVAAKHGAALSRYADDVTFSGPGDFPEQLREAVLESFAQSPWKLSTKKTKLSVSPQRLKVHGLLVHGNSVRLTKGYRNQLRAYEHLLKAGKISPDSLPTIRGHLEYLRLVEKFVATQNNGAALPPHTQ